MKTALSAFWLGLAALAPLAPQAASAQVDLVGEAFRACGGTRIVLAPAAPGDIPQDRFGRAVEVLNARLGAGLLGDFVAAQGTDRLIVSLPSSRVDIDAFAEVLARGAFTFHDVLEEGAPGLTLPMADDPTRVLTLDPTPLLTQDDVASAEPGFDYAQAPTVFFRFDERGARTFGQITADRIGQQLAVVYDGTILVAPTIMMAISGGEGQITGAFTVAETTNIATILRSGMLPIDLVIETVEQVPGNPELDQSACPPPAQ